MTPTVVRIRRRDGQVVQGCDVYIGRRWTMGGWDLPHSIWANPYHIGKDGSREECVAKYEAYVRSRPELLAQLPSLKDKTMGCFCDKAPCHGHVLIKLYEEYVSF